MNILKITPVELEEIISSDYKRFEVINNTNRPYKFQFEDYSKNGDVFTSVYFKDTLTFETYYIEYSYHTTNGYDFPHCIYTKPINLIIVSSEKESTLFDKKTYEQNINKNYVNYP